MGPRGASSDVSSVVMKRSAGDSSSEPVSAVARRTGPAERRTGMDKHETDFLSLTFAVMFLAIGVLFLTGEVDPAEFVRVWALPVALLGGGLVLGALGLARHRRLRSGAEVMDDAEEGTHPPLW